MMNNFYPTLLVLLTACTGLSITASTSKRGGRSKCSYVKDTFSQIKPTVSATILTEPEYDASLLLCKFTNHTETGRVSCCTHSTEQQLLLTSQAEYSALLQKETSAVTEQLGPEDKFRNHFTRMLAISKRMTEYELGSALNLPHMVGRETIEEFYTTLDSMLLSYNRSTSIFSAMDNLLDNLFAYVVREATTPGSREEPSPEYYSCLKENRRALHPSPFPQSLDNLAATLHYSAVAASFLSESMDVVYEVLNITRDMELSPHCLRDLMKVNHCQKCYGYTEMRPCRAFCEDIHIVCLNRVVKLDLTWEYHRKVVNMLSIYILTRVDPQPVLNTFHTDVKANLDSAILSYPSYKHELEVLCGPPSMRTSSTRHRIKVWEKPSTTSYDGDFSGDLRNLVVNMKLKAESFFSSLHSSICSSEPTSTSGECWDGLTERINKKKHRLDFSDDFAPYPDPNPDVTRIAEKIKRIRKDVLKIFVKSNKEEPMEGSGSGGGEGPVAVTDDTEYGDTSEEVTVKPVGSRSNTVTAITKDQPSVSYVPAQPENSIEITEEPQTAPKSTASSSARKKPIVADSSGQISRLSSIAAFLSLILVTSCIL